MTKPGEQLMVLKPENETLKKYISYYYFQTNQNSGEIKKFTFFPNTVNALTVYHNSKNAYSANNSTSKPTKSNQINYYYGGMMLKFMEVAIHSPYDKIAVAFNTLGINSFIDKPLSEIISKTEDLTFSYFKKIRAMDKVMSKVFETHNFNDRVKLLDDYFLALLNKFSEPTLERALQIIHSPENTKVQVNELADALGISQKTLTRKFKLHLNCTPKKYIEIHQFRSAFEAFILDDKIKKLTDLVYDYHYPDQSNFIHQFKKISGLNPRRFFKNVKKLGDGRLFWKELS